MAKGGPRAGSGRPRQEESQATDRAAARAARGLPPSASRAIDDGDWLTLPRDGRSGNAPAWPLTKPSRQTVRSARELVLWRRLWKTPQAVGWERIGVDHHQVALYVRYLAEAETGDAKQGTRNLVRQLAEHLGLTGPGLRMLHWRIAQPPKPHSTQAVDSAATDTQSAPAPVRPPAGKSARDRMLTLVHTDAG